MYLLLFSNSNYALRLNLKFLELPDRLPDTNLVFCSCKTPTTSSQDEVLQTVGKLSIHNSFDTISHHYSKHPHLPPALAIPFLPTWLPPMAMWNPSNATSRITFSSKLPQKLQIEVRCTLLVLHGPVKLTYAVGGIYSVLKSKAPVTTAEYGERYCLIGPLNRASVSCPPETGSTCPN
jgi:hypothetical protein